MTRDSDRIRMPQELTVNSCRSDVALVRELHCRLVTAEPLAITYFTEGERNIYLQTGGAAMLPVDPLVQSLHSEFLGETLTMFHPHTYFLLLWSLHKQRHVHSTQVKSRGVDRTSEQRTPSYLFQKVEQDHNTAMLETKITIADDRLIFTFYCKPMHTDQYLQYESHQLRGLKLEVICKTDGPDSPKAPRLMGAPRMLCRLPKAPKFYLSMAPHLPSVSGRTSMYSVPDPHLFTRPEFVSR